MEKDKGLLVESIQAKDKLKVEENADPKRDEQGLAEFSNLARHKAAVLLPPAV